MDESRLPGHTLYVVERSFCAFRSGQPIQGAAKDYGWQEIIPEGELIYLPAITETTRADGLYTDTEKLLKSGSIVPATEDDNPRG